MIKRICTFILVVSMFIYSSVNVLACDEEQNKIYVSKILFGDQVVLYENDKNLEVLLNALYVCSVQSNQMGQDKLDMLKAANVDNVPSLKKINIDGERLLECSHNTWTHKTKNIEKIQDDRKDVLRNTVIEVFDFGFIDETFNEKRGKIDSFSALLYYVHILSDYIADDPIDTQVSAKGCDVPAYTGSPFKEINGNKPSFTSKEKMSTQSFKQFSNLDGYGRAGVAIANIGPDILAPSDSRLNIGHIKPTGWNQEKYEGLVSSKPPYIYNRCHLIAHQLVGVDTENNLITGTRYLNDEMIPFENEVVRYIKNEGNHVLYRATPIYKGDNLVASGVQLEAYSIEDKGKGVCFNVYIYNVQPGVDIDYANGKTEREDIVYGKDEVLPFSTLNPNDSDPDLMFEIRKELEELFEDQKDSRNYKELMNELDSISNKARNVSGNTEWKTYITLKHYQYEYVEVLEKYVPILLAKEDFFNSVFNK